MNTALDAHIARVNSQDHSVFLGRLIWYTVSEVCVDHASVVAGLNKVGLTSQLPPAPRDHDVFRRVASNANVKKVATNVEGVFENYLVREVAGRGEEEIVRRIVCETVDRGSRNLNYNADLRDVIFNRNTGVISVNDLSIPNMSDLDDIRRRAMCDSITNSIRNEFNTWRGKLNSYAIREFIRKIVMRQFAATLVREGGGVYFVQEDQAASVDALEQFVESIDGASFHSLPLVDDRKQRDMVRKAFEAETIDEIDKMMSDINEIKQKGTRLSSDTYGKILSRYQELTSKTQGYGKMLEENLGETNTRLNLFQSAVVQLRTQVKQ